MTNPERERAGLLQPPPPILIPPPAARTSVPILDSVAPDPAHAAHIAAAWKSLRAANPRYHDGPILLLHSLDPLAVRRDTYRTLATAPQLDPSVRSLGVQGILRARDPSGHDHILFGRRSSETRIYGGLWENAPSGGMTAAPGRDRLTLADFTAALRDEGLEELGLDLADAAIRPLCLLDDPQAYSIDLVLEVRLPRPINPRSLPCPASDHARWEYLDAAWVPDREIRSWFNQNPASFSPSTLALIHHFAPT